MGSLKNILNDLSDFGIAFEIRQKLTEFITTANPEDLVKISPFKMAMDWQLPAYDVLDAFLYGTRLGLFDLQWNIRCPSCKGPTDKAETLNALPSQSHCPYCRIDIQGGFDDAVEITFRLHAGFRNFDEPHFKKVILATMPTKVQWSKKFLPGENIIRSVDHQRGTYHLMNEDFSLSAPLWIRGEEQREDNAIVYLYDGKQIDRKNHHFYPPGNYNLIIINNTDQEIRLVYTWAGEYPWVSASTLASYQNFRDLFSTQLISTDESFSIKNVSFVFTDIKGSTELYEKRGDSDAYYLVKEHFKILTEVVKKRHGAIVKTIGDAIMATFTRPEDAMIAVMEMHDAFDRFNTQENIQDEIIIKVGIHSGPCIAVTSNERLDYFGRTVNLAARIQGLSSGRDIMISDQFCNQGSVHEFISQKNWHTKPILAKLKGIEKQFPVIHLTRKTSI